MTSFRNPAALAEVHSLQSHFAAVLTLLRANPPARLDAAQRLTRALLLEELERYGSEGVFPQNPRSGAPIPVFVDDVGMHCAVGHLMRVSGQGALALEIRDRTNFAIVPSIAEDPRVVAWLEAAGLTAEEAALIQPSYCSDSPSTCVCESSGESPGTAAVLITTTREGRATVVQILWSKLDGIDVGTEIELAATSRTFQTDENFIVRVARNDQAGADAPAFIARQTLAVFTGDSMIPCSTLGARSLPLSKADAISALRSADPQACQNYLASLDKGWTTTAGQKDPDCGGLRGGTSTPAPSATASGDDWGNDPVPAAGGCDLGGLAASSPASLAVLASVALAIAARRARR